MQNLIKEIKVILSGDPFKEKVLIVPSLMAGRQLLDTIVKEEGCIFNLKAETLTMIAKNLSASYLCKNDLDIIEDTVAEEVLLKELKSLQPSLKYFNKLTITPGIAKAIYNSIKELKLSGIKSLDGLEDKFRNKDKANDLSIIFNNYQSFLKANKYIDKADLLTLTLTLNPTTDIIYILPNNLSLQPLEKEFINKILAKNLHIVNFTPIKGFGDEGPASVLKPISFLFDLDNAKPLDISLEMFKAYGENNEIKEVLRTIKDKDLSLDEVMILYTSKEPYNQYLYDLSQRLDLNITFGEGIDIKNTGPGKLFFALIT